MNDNGATEGRLRELERIIANRLNTSILSTRADIARGLGLQFSGKRDVYKLAGYPQYITYQEYLNRLLRQDIAHRVITAAPASTWRYPPLVFDGVEGDRRDDTEFVAVWRKITAIESVGADLVDAKSVWHYLRRVDILAGLGEYAILLVGVRDGLQLSEPLKRNSVTGPDGFLYLQPYAVESVNIQSKVEDAQDRRFGLPEVYEVDGVGEVHWSRVVHVAEDLLTDDIHGQPRAQAAYNRLVDLEKVLPAASEAAWKLMYKGMVLTTQEGYELPDDEVTTAKVDEYIHGLRRVLELEGLNVTFEGGEVVDPSALVDVLVTFISIATGIPKRILMGSERGELASSQDEANWAARISERQTDYAEPVILRPLINRLIYVGALPMPTNGAYSMDWRPLFELNDLERAQVAERYASAIRQAAPAGAPDMVVPPAEFRERFLGLPAESAMSANALLDIEDGLEDD